MKFLFNFLALAGILWSKSSAENDFAAFYQDYAASTTRSATGGACINKAFIHPLPNEGCAQCKPTSMQCLHGLFCIQYMDMGKFHEKCRIDEYTTSRTGCNKCYKTEVTNSSCPCCYKDATPCFSHTIPGVTDVDELRICVSNQADCHVMRADQLVFLCGEGDVDAVNDTIAQHGLDKVLNAENSQKWLCLHRAAARGRKDFVETILDAGARVDQRSNTNWTALHHAASSDSADVVRLLLERGADVEARAEGGETPLRIAIGGNGTESIVALMRKGATMKNAKDSDRQNGFDERIDDGDVKRAIKEGTLGFCEKNALCKNGGTCAYENEALICICRHSLAGRYCEKCKDICVPDELHKLQEGIKGFEGETKYGINETRIDIVDLKNEIKEENNKTHENIVEMRDEIKKDIKENIAEMNNKFTDLKNEMTNKINGNKAEMNNKFTEMKNINTGTQTKIVNLRGEVDKMKTEMGIILTNQKEILKILKGIEQSWILIQRHDFSVPAAFKDKKWAHYKQGFGISSESSSEFWLGNDELHALTSCGCWTLRIRAKWDKNDDGSRDTRAGTYGSAEWPNFKVGSEANKYRLGIGRKSKSDNFAGDPFHSYDGSAINGMAFGTRDRDNDKWGRNCATDNLGDSGGWWYNTCSRILLNSRAKFVLFLQSKWRHPSESSMWIKRN